MTLLVRIITLGSLLVIIVIATIFTRPRRAVSPALTPTVLPTSTTQQLITPTLTPTEQLNALREPVAEFAKRVMKKPFGIYVTPQNSPIQPERFTGFHTGADAEYGDKPGEEIPVNAIAPGTIEVARWVSGYGGVIVIRHQIEGKDVLALYGHIDPDTFLKTTTVKAGEQLGTLGEGGTQATDGERKHLHFAVLKTQTVSLPGYVQTKKELESGWQNPLELFF